jgi:hypothetical protein
MYPTPLLLKIEDLHPEYEGRIHDIIFWLFWSGIYIPSDGSTTAKQDLLSHAPMYVLLVVLILERIA